MAAILNKMVAIANVLVVSVDACVRMIVRGRVTFDLYDAGARVLTVVAVSPVTSMIVVQSKGPVSLKINLLPSSSTFT